ncbi:MAG: hypothetical protein IKF59_04445 [Lachnospiraceae bacterium]|nr:hypothetical protein [Lachnospiraceae bacterium]
MAFVRRTYRLPGAEEVVEYYTGRYGPPGQARVKKQRPTPEQMARQNQRHREDTCRRKMRCHFREGDYYVTFTYRVEERPADMDQAKKHWAAAVRKLRDAYRKKGYKLKWIRNIEVGTRGGWHIHAVINRIPDGDLLLTGSWPHGIVKIIHCYGAGGFRKLAAYLTKTPMTDKRLKESHYWTSRDLPVPEPEVKVIRYKEFRKPCPPKGWVLEKESFCEGVSEVTGYAYRRYCFIREGGRKPEEDAQLDRSRMAGGKRRKRKRKRYKEGGAEGGRRRSSVDGGRKGPDGPRKAEDAGGPGVEPR